MNPIATFIAQSFNLELAELCGDIVGSEMEKFGFEGIIMTDWVVASGFLTGPTKYAAPDPAKVAAAGCSLFMPGSKKDHRAFLDGLQKGTVTRKKLQENAGYLLQLLEQRIAAPDRSG